jgi:hypothetical protein
VVPWPEMMDPPTVDPLVDLLMDGLRYQDDRLTLDPRALPKFLVEARKIDDRGRFRAVISEVIHLAYVLAEKRGQPRAGDDLLRAAVALVPALTRLLGADASGDWSEVRKHLAEQERIGNPTTAAAIEPPTAEIAFKRKPNRG